jgi:hypothetical protein
MGIWQEVDLGEIYKFEDFVTQHYLNEMKRFWDKHKT